MIERSALVRKSRGRFWAAAISCILSGCFIQAAQGGYGQVPTFFVENQGQFGAEQTDVRYIVKGPALSGYLSANRAVLNMGQSTFGVRFQGANPTAAIEGIHELPARIHFMLGAPSQWRVDLPAYGGIAYRDIFPGIDLVYSVAEGRLKTDFLVAPGANPAAIHLQYEGAGPAHLDPNGLLVLAGSSGELRESAPLVHQEIFGRRRPVKGSFVIGPDGNVGFHIGPYDRSRPLLIDPVLSYSTYLGGSSMDAITSIAIDNAGNAYVAGWTTSTDLPILNPVRTQNGGGVDAFVAKLGPGGNRLIYCTYLGGRGDDRAFGIAVDSAGDAYVTGWTSSAAFPTAVPMQSSLAGAKDAFAARLNPAGNALIYSTYLGGSNTDSGNAIAVDAAGNAYIAGGTYSFNFPLLNGYQTSIHGQQNGFVAKLSPSGSLMYSTYLGGNGSDSAAGIAVNAAGNAYVTGGTTSTTFPTAAPLQASSGGNQDAFVTKLGPSGNVLIYSTYLGGSGGASGSMEAGTGIAIDSTGAAYVTGGTNSTNFPVTAGALQSANMGEGDAFVAKLNPAGSALVYSTYLGGSSVDSAGGIAVDFLGNAYIAGHTASSDFLNLRGFQAANAGSYDAFVTKLNPAGTGIIWSTYLGGTSSDAAYAVAADPLGNAYVAGLTQSNDLPLLNPIQSFNGGSYGGFVSKVSSGWVAGVFLNGSWYIDRNRNGGFDGTAAGDQIFSFGQSGDIPVTGDWTGSGTVRLGVFRNGQWLLDCNGNGAWDGAAGGDCVYNFGQAGDKPVVGDWSGNGKTKIGIFRGGFWMLDLNGNGQWDGASGGDSGFYLGNASYTPVVGDWSGSGTSKAGLFLNGTWYLDTNGDGLWDQADYFGQAGDIPLAGDWGGSGKSNIGVYRTGYWILDMNGNGILDGVGIGEAAFWLGNSSFTPVLLR
ncbi:MAG TPA: SBBP repeat-containing protein [Bryobacteraceae bacterium]|nr:SBBP repeat-containing protein [Bryobacteraceae bacterium]